MGSYFPESTSHGRNNIINALMNFIFAPKSIIIAQLMRGEITRQKCSLQEFCQVLFANTKGAEYRIE